MFYAVVLVFHNIIRWVALILGILAVVRAYLGWFGKREWSETDRKTGLFYTIAMDVQLLLGLFLYIFFSPLTRQAFQDLGGAMANPNLRFFALEHAFYMILALVSAHLGSILPRRASESLVKYRRAAIWFSLALLFILLGMPWTRPLFRGF